jgi:hypothetical protein
VLLARASQIDTGFDATVLADMISTFDRFTDSEIHVPEGSSAAELQPVDPGLAACIGTWVLGLARCPR